MPSLSDLCNVVKVGDEVCDSLKAVDIVERLPPSNIHWLNQNGDNGDMEGMPVTGTSGATGMVFLTPSPPLLAPPLCPPSADHLMVSIARVPTRKAALTVIVLVA